MKAQHRNNLMVANFVSAGRRHKRAKKPKITLTSFFNDLENRGPVVFRETSLFERWTKRIRADLKKEKAWVRDGMTELDIILFVQKYITRLQERLWSINRAFVTESKKDHSPSHKLERHLYWCGHELKGCDTFLQIHKQIRVFGLRQKLYYVAKFNRRKRLDKTILKTFITPYEFGVEEIEPPWRGYQHLSWEDHLPQKIFYCRPGNLNI